MHTLNRYVMVHCATKYFKADNSCSPDFPSALQVPLHATFQQAGCTVGSVDQDRLRLGSLCKLYLVFNPTKWYCCRGGCRNWGSGSHHCRRPNNSTKLINHHVKQQNDIQLAVGVLILITKCPYWPLLVNPIHTSDHLALAYHTVG